MGWKIAHQPQWALALVKPLREPNRCKEKIFRSLFHHLCLNPKRDNITLYFMLCLVVLLASLCRIASRLLVLWHVIIVPYRVKSSDGIRAIFRLDNRFMELVKPVSEFTFQLETDQLCLSAVLVPSIVAITQDHIHKLYLLKNMRTGKTVDKPSGL